MGSKVEKKTSEFKATPLNKEPGHSLKSPKSPKAPKTPRTSKTPKSGITDSQVLFLWTCLENSSIMKEGGGSGSNNINWDAVAEKMGLQKGAALKRFSRLRIAMRNKNPKTEEGPQEGQAQKAQESNHPAELEDVDTEDALLG